MSPESINHLSYLHVEYPQQTRFVTLAFYWLPIIIAMDTLQDIPGPFRDPPVGAKIENRQIRDRQNAATVFLHRDIDSSRRRQCPAIE